MERKVIVYSARRARGRVRRPAPVAKRVGALAVGECATGSAGVIGEQAFDKVEAGHGHSPERRWPMLRPRTGPVPLDSWHRRNSTRLCATVCCYPRELCAPLWITFGATPVSEAARGFATGAHFLCNSLGATPGRIAEGFAKLPALRFGAMTCCFLCSFIHQGCGKLCELFGYRRFRACDGAAALQVIEIRSMSGTSFSKGIPAPYAQAFISGRLVVTCSHLIETRGTFIQQERGNPA